jgi:hypothetical protein
LRLLLFDAMFVTGSPRSLVTAHKSVPAKLNSGALLQADAVVNRLPELLRCALSLILWHYYPGLVAFQDLVRVTGPARRQFKFHDWHVCCLSYGGETFMTVRRLSGVGYCASFSQVGDWAFEFAFRLARRHDIRLNIFFFPDPPYKKHPIRGRRGERLLMGEKEEIDLERRVRLYYDNLLGDFVNVGFRLCEGDEDPELRRCLLIRKDYDLLVLAYEHRGCLFGERPIEEFVERMPCPIVLVGPSRKDEVHLSTPARLWAETLGLNESEHLLVR